MNKQEKKPWRKMKPWVGTILVLVIAVLWWHRWSASNVIAHLSGDSLMLVGREGLEFGSVGPRNLASKDVLLFNSSFSSIELIGSDQTCQCAFVERGFLPVKIKAGQAMNLPIKLSTMTRDSGKVRENVILLTNRNTRVVIPISAVVESSGLQEIN